MLHQIGAGTLGPVFRGHDTERERLVTVKLFKIDMPPEQVHQLVARLEKIVAAALAHPNIATPVAAGITGISAYLAYEYIAADSMDTTVREFGAVQPADALQIGARLAGALDHGVAAGFTHGCLHPRDVLMSAHETRLTGIGVGQALADIGLAVPVRRPYTAPERVDASSWDRRADVFSLAALVHELLWGRRISGIGPQATEGMTPIPGGDLDALKRVFKRALAQDPGERHPTPKIFVDALKRALPEVVVDLSLPVAAAAPAPARNLRLAASSRTNKQETMEPLLPLASAELEDDSNRKREPPRFLDVDVEPASAAPLKGPSILEDGTANAEPPLRVTVEDEHPHDPLALSWLSREAEPAPLQELALTPEPVPAAEPPRVAEIVIAAPPPEPSHAVEPQAAAPVPTPPQQAVAEAVAPAPEKPAAPKRKARLEREEPPAVERREPPAVERREPREPREAAQQVPIEFSMLEQSRSAVWPLVLALVIGGALGFAGGYAVGVREHPAAVVAAAPAASPAPSREFTEGTVAAAPKPAVAPASAAPAAAAPPPAKVRLKADAPPAARTPEPPKPSTVAGRLNIRSTPPGAKVFVDDRETGRTPTSVGQLGEGPHVVRIVRDGYAAHDRRIVITKERPVQLITAALTRQTPPASQRAAAAAPERPARAAAKAPVEPPAPVGRGSLTVDSRPAGARVFIDGKLAGTTPMASPAIAAGDHTIRLEYDGYRNWIGAVRIVASEQARVTASLER